MFARNLEGARVWLQLHDQATAREYQDLGQFVHECVERVEREVGRAASWKIHIVPDRVCFSCDVIVQYGDAELRANGAGFDSAVACWHAFRKIEDQLREYIGTDVTRANVAADATRRVA
jgi:ribosome-associated translation inhibitor RaiA